MRCVRVPSKGGQATATETAGRQQGSPPARSQVPRPAHSPTGAAAGVGAAIHPPDRHAGSLRLHSDATHADLRTCNIDWRTSSSSGRLQQPESVFHSGNKSFLLPDDTQWI